MSTAADLKEQRDALREQVEVASLERELAQLQEQTQAIALINSVVLREAWGEQIIDRPGQYNPFGNDTQRSAILDRRDGDNYPFWVTEAQHQQITGLARWIHGSQEIAISAIANLMHYVIGDGFDIQADPKDKFADDAEAQSWAIEAQDILDRVLDSWEWWGDLEQELFTRSRRDGEFFIGVEPRSSRDVGLILPDPPCITEPENAARLEDHLGIGESLNWKYGIATRDRDTSTPLGFFCDWDGTGTGWEFYDSRHMVHAKLNVDRQIKRGLSDFYAPSGTLEKGGKLFSNLMHGSAVQAAIAYVREHAQGTTADDLEEMAAARSTATATRPAGPGGRAQTTRQRKIEAGQVVDVTAGLKYTPGPLGDAQRGAAFMDIVQGAIRIVGARFQMPEYMISGDASNANYASSLVSEAPFTKSAENKQNYYKRTYTKIMWLILSAAAEKGAFDGAPVHVLKRKLKVAVEGAQIASRDPQIEHTINQAEYAAGIRSRRSWQIAAKLDPDEQDAQIKQEGAAKPKPAESQAE